MPNIDTTISWDAATEVGDAHQAIAALETMDDGSLALLRTPEGGLATLGSRFWKAVGTKLVREFSDREIIIIVDAGEDAGIAMSAIADGHKALRFTGEADMLEKLQAIGRDNDCMVIAA